MVTRGLLVRLAGRPEKEDTVEAFLRGSLPLVYEEPATTVWFAIKFGHHEYGIFDAFPDELGLNTHLEGAVGTALKKRSAELFVRPPQIERVHLLAAKRPVTPPTLSATKGLLLRLKPKADHTERLEEFLRQAQRLADEEPKTLEWFALRFEDGTYGVFDVFPNQSGRLAHLAGQVARELTKHAVSLLGGTPQMDMFDVLAEKIDAHVPA